ncbi:hypothetical protein D918_04084 [Trichuris suis]|nr:hypothetical protein D918_04084 [Trichuris suis]
MEGTTQPKASCTLSPNCLCKEAARSSRMNPSDSSRMICPETTAAMTSTAAFASKMHSWGKRSRSCGNARRNLTSLYAAVKLSSAAESSFFVNVCTEATSCTNGSDDSDGSCCETLVAIKGVTLKDALAGLTKKYQFNIERINIFLKSSNTPLPLETDTSFLGGLKVFLRNSAYASRCKLQFIKCYFIQLENSAKIASGND